MVWTLGISLTKIHGLLDQEKHCDFLIREIGLSLDLIAYSCICGHADNGDVRSVTSWCEIFCRWHPNFHLCSCSILLAAWGELFISNPYFSRIFKWQALNHWAHAKALLNSPINLHVDEFARVENFSSISGHSWSQVFSGEGSPTRMAQPAIQRRSPFNLTTVLENSTRKQLSLYGISETISWDHQEMTGVGRQMN